ncbi:MAG: hypothetical protein ACFFB5_01510 [Promethearchaeota archaeon]
MKEIVTFKTEYLAQEFKATVFFKENGIFIDITGPNDHLGGIGVGVPYVRKNGEKSANYHCISLPNHRDGELAANIARVIAKITRYYTVVILGIHYPELKKEQLKGLILFFEEWAIEIGESILIEIS